MSRISLHIHINGIVQGVGFRPFIYNLAVNFGLNGWVRNSASGVDIEVTGSQTVVDTFLAAIPKSAPPLAQIDSIDVQQIDLQVFEVFSIVKYNLTTDFIPVSPDVALCSQLPG